MPGRASSTEVVYRASDGRAGHVRALALKAAGIDHVVAFDGREFVILVSAEDAPAALEEIEAYDEENPEPTVEEPVRHVPHEPPSRGWFGVAGYAAALIGVAGLEHYGLISHHWMRAGMTHAEAIRHGEVWRTITALTLHADGLHLVSNLLFGGLFGLFAGQILGSGLAWLSILLAGGAGNLLNAWIREPQHTSIGASTAVFATLGMVAALSWSRRMPGRRSWMLRLSPLIGAAVLLSFLGTGGERTDVLAHVTGFTSGAALGAIESRLSDRIRRSRIFQCILGFAAIGLLVVSWAVALRSA